MDQVSPVNTELNVIRQSPRIRCGTLFSITDGRQKFLLSEKVFSEIMDKSGKSADADECEEKTVSVKSEPEEDTIKNYAEHTMNELLGLFGYEDKVNSTDTENLNLENYTENADGDTSPSADVTGDVKDRKSRLKTSLRRRLLPLDDNALAQQHMNLVTALKRREKEEAETAAETGSQSENEPSQECAWCRKPGNKQISLDTPTGSKVFCSEICFTQCRRASFKKSKTCDWCKHVRHTVNYVEFQDGETQLQFCSEKCLNQYKMSIFCKETQEHLQKMNKKGEEQPGTKDGEQEILITPELWMRSEHARRAAEARESARERERQERREDRENYRKTFTISADKLATQKINNKIDTSEKSRLSLLDRIKNEAKHKRIIPEKEPDRLSPAKSEPQGSSPSPHTETPIPAHMLHPSVAMNPWLHQAQLMGAFPPGLLPYGHMPPFMLAGFLPPPPPGFVSDNRDKEESEQEKKNTKREQASNSSRQNHAGLLSPGSDRSALSGSSPRNDSRISPGITERRTSSLFPVDFPQFFQGQNGVPGMTDAMNQRSGIPGIPPVTMMLPFPVPLPLPVPIPIPIPLTMKQLTSIFGENEKDEKAGKMNKTSAVPKINIDKKYESRSPLPSYVHSPQSMTSGGSEYNATERQEGRSGSRNSCPDLSLYVNIGDSRLKRSESHSYKRCRTPESMRSLDLSRNSKIPRYEYKSISSDSNDGVIDLSSTRDNGHRSEDNVSESSLVNGNVNDETNLSRDDNDNYTDDGQLVPKIHIITHKDESPLNQPLPLPPTENPYSSRRGLILDAPVIPKKSRSPSPERRVYVRNVPRDIIEAARRRCMRSRVRTK